jgi:hypothetical protein
MPTDEKEQTDTEQPPKLDRDNPPPGYEKAPAGGEKEPEKNKKAKE